MTLSSRDFHRLKEIAGPFQKGNHGRFLAEAMQALRGAEDPLAAVELLAALHGTAYAGRANEREALDAVGTGLVALLTRNPEVSAQRLLLEVGWLRRLAESKEETPRSASRPQEAAKRREPGPRRPPPAVQQDRWRSPETLADLRRRRAQALQAAAPGQQQVVRRAAAEERPVAPTVLPESFEALLADVFRAREIRKTYADRQKRGKAPRDARLDLKPVDPALAELARGLHASTLRTRGIEDLFAALRDAGAGSVRLRVRVRMVEGVPFAEEVEAVRAT